MEERPTGDGRKRLANPERGFECGTSPFHGGGPLLRPVREAIGSGGFGDSHGLALERSLSRSHLPSWRPSARYFLVCPPNPIYSRVLTVEKRRGGHHHRHASRASS